MGSGSLEVYATPAMLALMEKAACNIVDSCLDEETTSVGISVNLSHDAATAVGKTVTAKAVLVGVDGRKLTFKITVSDNYGTIGQGTHERFLVNKAKFLGKLAAKDKK